LRYKRFEKPIFDEIGDKKMSKERFFSLEAMTNMFYTGKVTSEEMRKRDFRKAIQITSLSVISSIIVAIIAFLVDFS
jgi:hypothetical protein